MIDFSKPYGTITGDFPARYLQDGKYFDVHGKEIDSEPTEENVQDSESSEIDTSESVARPGNLGQAKNDVLKALISQAGQEWTDRKSAIAWLKENG